MTNLWWSLPECFIDLHALLQIITYAYIASNSPFVYTKWGTSKRWSPNSECKHLISCDHNTFYYCLLDDDMVKYIQWGECMIRWAVKLTELHTANMLEMIKAVDQLLTLCTTEMFSLHWDKFIISWRWSLYIVFSMSTVISLPYDQGLLMPV